MRDYEKEETMSYEEYLEYKKGQKKETEQMKESAEEIVVQENELKEANGATESFEAEDASNQIQTGVVIYENKDGRISYEFIGEVTLAKAIFYREFYSRAVDEIWDKQTEV